MVDQKVSKQILQDWKRVVSAVQLEAKARNEHTIAFLLGMAIEEMSASLPKDRISQPKIVKTDGNVE
tara:strand:- start:2928 stop:3128 length:201 start_codon:yes stop_codon:yes gene_type:complete